MSEGTFSLGRLVPAAFAMGIVILASNILVEYPVQAMIGSFNVADWVTYGAPPHKFEAGTPAIVESIGLGAAIDYVNSIGKERIAAHEHDLLTYAEERLREINALRIIGNAKGKGPVISFEMKGAHPHDVATVIDRQGIAVRAGTHCVMPLLERFQVTATCRASFGMYNTREEVDQLVSALIKARDLFS